MAAVLQYFYNIADRADADAAPPVSAAHGAPRPDRPADAPADAGYLAMKWQAYGRFCHLFSLLLYAIFVFLVTINAMNLMTLVRHCPVLLDTDGSVMVNKDDIRMARRDEEGDGEEHFSADCDIRGVSWC